MRVFAGPNGSGKTTIIKEIQKTIYTGILSALNLLKSILHGLQVG
jgi:predicted ABC-type ATPase